MLHLSVCRHAVVEGGDQGIDGRFDDVFVDASAPIRLASLFDADKGEGLGVGLFAQGVLFVGDEGELFPEVLLEGVGDGV